MLVTNALLRHTSLIMFLVFFSLETLLFISIVFVFNYELPKCNENITQSVETYNEELLKSFASFMNSTIMSKELDLSLMHIYNEILSLKDSNPLDQTTNCVCNKNISLNDNYTDNPIFNYFNKKELFDNETNRIIIEDLEEFIQENIPNVNLNDENCIDTFDQIYQYNYKTSQDSSDDNEINICLLLKGFKSLVIKNIINEQNGLIFNKLYLLFNNFIYVYPAFNGSDLLLPIIKDGKTNCNAELLYSCLENFYEFTTNNDNLPNYCYSHNDNSDEFVYFHHLFKSQFLLSCSLFGNNGNGKGYYLCLLNNLASIFNYLFESFINSKMSSYSYLEIAITDTNFRVINSFFNKIPNITNEENEISNYPSLFHLLYYDILNNSNISDFNCDSNDNSKFSSLCQEYDELITKITSSINSTSLVHLDTKASYLEIKFNSSGKLDFSQSEIIKDSFVFSIQPINLHRNIYNKSTSILKNETNNISTHYIIAIMNMNINSRSIKLFKIFCFRFFTKWSFFTILLIIFCALFSVVFTKFLDSIFSPISTIIKHFRKKLLNQTEKPLEENEEVSLSKYNSSINQINSKTPEIIELINISRFLVNILDMKKFMEQKIEANKINFALMNSMFSELKTNEERIQYGFFISSFYYQTTRYNDCWKSIKNIKTYLQTEKETVINEKENIDLEVLNHLSNFPYVNDFFPSSKIFNKSEQHIPQYYYEFLIKSEKIYFMYAICFMNKSKQLKRINKKLQASLSLSIIEPPSSPRNKRLGSTKLKMITNNSYNKSNRIELEIHYNKKEILMYYEKAIKYFNKSNEINNKYSINKIKSIIILLYICKCYIYLERKTEAIETIKKCIESFYYLNTNLIEQNHKLKLNARIMLLVNATIIEQILFLIGVINKDDKRMLSAKLFSQTLSISHFKTDYIQSKSAKYLNQIFKYNLIETPIYLPLNKISLRLSKKSKERTFYRKNLFIFFSAEFVKVLPTKIELCEIISKCVKKYLHENDNVFCARFDNYREPSIKKVSEFSKEYLMKLINENFRENISKYGMQEAISFATSTIIPSILKESKGIRKEESKNNIKKEYIIDSEGVIHDNYIFQFILTSDYVFSSYDQNNTFRNNLNDKCVSLYTFVFDIAKLGTKESLQESIPIKKIKKDKRGKIIHHLRKLNEGVLLLVDNFTTIKSAFQNISKDFPKKNVFNVDCELCKNIYLDYHV